MAKKYVVVFEPDEGDWWAVSIPSVKGVRTQAKSIEQGHKRIREALALAIGDDEAAKAELVDDVQLPARAKELLRTHAELAEQAKILADKARKASREAAKALEKQGLSRRDSAALLHVSHQRVQQILEGDARN